MKKLNKNNLFIITAIVLAWLGLESLFYRIADEAQSSYKNELVKQAAIYYKDILKTQEWSDTHSGVYIKSIAKGDFIKVTPSWMKQMNSKDANREALRYALVSNNPINPENRAKGFYAESLTKIEKTRSYKAEYLLDELNQRLQYIKPIYITEDCLSCHGVQGYKIGDVRGGIALDMDASFTLDRIAKAWFNFYMVSALFTSLILAMLYFISKLSRQRVHYLKLNAELEARLEVKIKKLNQTLIASGLGYWHWNLQTDEHTVDDQWLAIIGLHRADLKDIISDWNSKVHPDDLKSIFPTLNNAIKSKEPYVVEFRMRHSDGHYIWIQGAGCVTSSDENGKALHLSGTHQDITQRKLLELEHKHNLIYLNTLFEKNPNIIIVTDGKKLIKSNDAFFRFFSEYDSLDAFLKEHNCICDFFQGAESEKFITNEYGNWIEESLTSSAPIAKIVYLRVTYYFAVHAKKVYDEGSMRMLVTFNDITETYRLKQRFEELSVIDELTKTFNRRYFNKVFRDEINRAKREKHSFSFAIMDIDNFKLYNDHYGHDEGDEALKSLAKEVKYSIKRANEFFFRLGGEEFGIIFSGTSKEGAVEYIKKQCKLIEELNIAHTHNLPYKKLTVSIGLCFVEAGDTMDSKQIYRQADTALYLAKDNGRNRVEIFEKEQT